MKLKINNLAFWLIFALFVFLPFSSWLVSLYDNIWISLARDVLVFLIVLLSLVNFRKINRANLVIALLFILFGLVTYFWKSSSSEQWLRGFRFYFVPIVFYLALCLIELSKKQKSTILWVVLSGFAIVGLVGILEVFGLRVPLAPAGANNLGTLEKFQGLGSDIVRIQSLLAGPNALGLYLVAVSGILLSAFSLINRKLIYLLPIAFTLVVLTFSRSALIGIFILFLVSLFIYLSKKYSVFIASSFAVLMLAIILIVGIKMYRSDQYSYYITHGASTSLRTEQIKRIWQSRDEIGLLGRGVGTAGPSSHNRLDGGPNHWSENIYLDTFEELGLIGLVIYLLLIYSIYAKIVPHFSNPISKSTFLIVTSFLIMGLFINIYTGQVGIYLFWLFAGLSGKEQNG